MSTAPLATADMVGRFSQVATVCVVLLGLTGLIRGVMEIADLANLTDTDYGAALLAKLALLLPLLGIAALNLFLIQRRLGQLAATPEAAPRTHTWVGRLRLSTGGEVLLVSAVLLATAVLTSLPPAREAFGSGLVIRGQAQDVRVILVVSPGEAGLNTFTLHLRDANGQPLEGAQKVALLLEHVDMEMGISEVVATPLGEGRYQAQGGQVAMSGRWQGEVLVRRGGLDDVRAPLEFNAADPPGAPSLGTAPGASLPVRLLFGLELIAAGVVLALGARRLGRARVWVGRGALAAGLGLALYGGYTAVQGFYAEVTPAVALTNPVPADARSLGRGQEIYLQRCAACHGESGRGDGPAGLALRPQPADFRVHMAAGHTDGQLFWWLSEGMPGTAMPAFEETLSEQERWDAINFIKTFAQPSLEAPPTGQPPVSGASSGGGATASQPSSTTPAAGASVSAAPTLASQPPRPSPGPRPTSSPVVPDAAGRIVVTRTSGELQVRVTLVPRALGTSEYEVALENLQGQPLLDARRVSLKLAMQGMNHSLFSREARPTGRGIYLASGNDLIMSGPWQGWVVVELADGSVTAIDFSFQSGPEQPDLVQAPIRADMPPGIQLVSLAAYPNEDLPREFSLNPGSPIRVEAVLADGARCGGRLRMLPLGLEAPFSDNGFAWLQFNVDRPLKIVAQCTEQGLDLIEAR